VRATADAAAHALAEDHHRLLGDAPTPAHEEALLGGEAAPGDEVDFERDLGGPVQGHDAIRVAAHKPGYTLNVCRENREEGGKRPGPTSFPERAPRRPGVRM
jgi:hypothetical protein